MKQFNNLLFLFSIIGLLTVGCTATKKTTDTKKTTSSSKTTASASSSSQGTILYEVVDCKTSSDNPQMEMAASMMKGSTTEVTFKGDKVKTHMDMMGGMSKNTVFSNLSDETGTLFLDVPMQAVKYKVKMSKEDSDEFRKNMPSYTFTYDKSKTKDIAGYTCHLATGTDEDDNSIELYVTDKITSDAFKYQYNGLKGFPLEYTSKQGPFESKMVAKKISSEVSADFFTMPEGFEEKTMDDLKKMGMGG